MSIERIYAHLSCSNLGKSADWFGRLFDRQPDARPMEGLAEWHHENKAGLQVFEDASNAGKGTLTIIVSNLREEHSRLTDAGLGPSAIQPADATSLVTLRDPDRNLVVLAQPERV